MQHIFDVEIAVKYGMEVATFIKNISFWIVKNQSNNEHFHDGRYWTYNKLDAFTLIFPYWSKYQIRRIITKCINCDLIVKGNYNKTGYDQTLWYSLSDFGHKLLNIPIIPNQHIHVSKSPNGDGETNTPIPDVNTDSKQQIKDKRKAPLENQVAVVSEPIVLPDWLPKEVWEEFKQHRKQLKKPMSDLSQKKSIKLLEKMRSEGQDIVQVIETSIANEWQGLFEIKLKGNEYGKINGRVKEKSWNERSTKFMLDFCGLPGDAGIASPKVSIPSEVQQHLQDGRRFDEVSSGVDDFTTKYLRQDNPFFT